MWHLIGISQEGKVVAEKIFELKWSSIVFPGKWEESFFLFQE